MKQPYNESKWIIKKVKLNDAMKYHLYRTKKENLYYVTSCKDFDAVMTIIRAYGITKYQIVEDMNNSTKTHIGICECVAS